MDLQPFQLALIIISISTGVTGERKFYHFLKSNGPIETFWLLGFSHQFFSNIYKIVIENVCHFNGITDFFSTVSQMRYTGSCFLFLLIIDLIPDHIFLMLLLNCEIVIIILNFILPNFRNHFVSELLI